MERGGHRYNLILKYRQGGVTTFYEIDELDEALWVPGMTCGIIAHEAKKLPEYFNIVKLAMQYLPKKLQPETKTDSKYMYEFTKRYDGLPLNSSIYVATDIRGGTVQRLHITESAYIKDRQKLKSGSKQAVPLTGYISEETTANGFNEFYDDYTEADEDPNPGPMDYRTYFYSWVEHPEYTLPGTIEEYDKTELDIKKIALEKFGIAVTDGQLLWRRWKKKELFSKQDGVGLSGDQLFKQEYPLTKSEAFQSGLGNVFDGVKVEDVIEQEPMTLAECYQKINEIYNEGGNANAIMKEKLTKLHKQGVMFWELPQIGRLYVIGCDPSDGLGADNGALDVWDDKGVRQVAQFYGKLRPDELAELAAELGYFYNEAFIGVENNMLSTILFLVKIYTNYYFYTEIDKKNMKKTKKIGYNTNSKTRDVMIDDYIIFFDEDNLLIRSKITKKEMKTFVKKDNGKREHADGKFDDALFAAFIALQMRKYNKNRARAFQQNPLNM